jgi:hypothetical protein
MLPRQTSHKNARIAFALSSATQQRFATVPSRFECVSRLRIAHTSLGAAVRNGEIMAEREFFLNFLTFLSDFPKNPIPPLRLSAFALRSAEKSKAAAHQIGHFGEKAANIALLGPHFSMVVRMVSRLWRGQGNNRGPRSRWTLEPLHEGAPTGPGGVRVHCSVRRVRMHCLIARAAAVHRILGSHKVGRGGSYDAWLSSSPAPRLYIAPPSSAARPLLSTPLILTLTLTCPSPRVLQ